MPQHPPAASARAAAPPRHTAGPPLGVLARWGFRLRGGESKGARWGLWAGGRERVRRGVIYGSVGFSGKGVRDRSGLGPSAPAPAGAFGCTRPGIPWERAPPMTMSLGMSTMATWQPPLTVGYRPIQRMPANRSPMGTSLSTPMAPSTTQLRPCGHPQPPPPPIPITTHTWARPEACQ